MASKKPASMKVIDGKKEKETFDAVAEIEQFKEIETIKLEAEIKNAKRIDKWCNIRANATEFFGETPLHSEVDDWADVVQRTYEAMLFAIKDWHIFEEDGSLSTKFVDPYEHLIKTARDCANDVDSFEAALIYATVMPYGSSAESTFFRVDHEIGGAE